MKTIANGLLVNWEFTSTHIIGGFVFLVLAVALTWAIRQLIQKPK